MGMHETFSGMYRGVVEDVADPDKRYRMRVRVHEVHSDVLPVDTLPWAEFCGFVGKGFGDVPHYAVGDVVWVTFERGDRNDPVVMGAYCRAPDDVPDFPTDATKESSVDPYATYRGRWIKADRYGNYIMMSENAGDTSIKIFGNSESASELSVEIHGNAKIHLHTTEELLVECGTLNANVTGNAELNVDGKADVSVVGDITVDSTSGQIAITSASKIDLTAATEVNISCATATIGAGATTVGPTPALVESLAAGLLPALLGHVHDFPAQSGVLTGIPMPQSALLLVAALTPVAAGSLTIKMQA